MPNLVQLSNELEYVPKEQLAQMSQDPSSRFPQYLVLSEIQRRTANEKAYAAAQPQPTTTVAEEVVGEFMQPKGLQAGMPSESAPTDSFSSEPMGMPASAPMQQPMQQPMMMASGGITGYAVGGPAMSPLDRSFISGLGDSIYDRYTDEDGLDYSQALLDASMLIPGTLLARGAGLGLKGLYQSGRLGDAARFLGRQGQRLYSKKRGPVDVKVDTIPSPLGPVGVKLPGKGREFAPLRAGVSSAAIGIPAANIVDYMSEDNQIAQEEKRELTQTEKDYQKIMQDIQLANLKASQKDTKKGLGGGFSPTDLIQLGGTIMSAKNISELGQGIAGVAGASAERKTAAERAGLEARFLRAQTGKLEEETRLLPETALTKKIDSINAAIKLAVENGDDQQVVQLQQFLQYLVAQQAQTAGYNPQAMSGTNKNLIASYT
tara:strand:- start:3917 stop:5215 length:1299 start_codon:yes stop_codon:yes gene_type:complete